VDPLDAGSIEIITGARAQATFAGNLGICILIQQSIDLSRHGFVSGTQLLSGLAMPWPS